MNDVRYYLCGLSSYDVGQIIGWQIQQLRKTE
jgi:hypothetical protein